MLPKFLIFFILFAHFGDAAIKLPMKRHELEGYKLFKQGRFLEYRALKNQSHIHKSRAERFATGKSGLSDASDVLFTVQVSFGNPPQVFTLFPNTAYLLTWIPDVSVDNPYNPEDKVCENKHCFNSNASSTYIDAQKRCAYSENINGIQGIDTVRIGNTGEKLTIANVTFCQVTKPPYWIEDIAIDGILGLAFKPDVKDVIEPVFETAFREGLVDQPIFTIWLKPTDNGDGNGGQITWGGHDLEHCSSETTYLPVKQNYDYYYEFKLDGYSVNNGRKGPANWTGITNSGAVYTYIPSGALQHIVDAVNATYDYKDGFYLVDCDAKFNLTFYTNDRPLTIDEKVGVFSHTLDDGSKVCHLGFEGWAYYGADVILGEAFLREWCSVYDTAAHRIGFARSIKN